MTQPRTIEGRHFTSFVESPNRPKHSSVEVLAGDKFPIIDVTPFGKFDKIIASYPDNITEIYTYSLQANDIGTVTVTYTDASKKFISMVTYNAV